MTFSALLSLSFMAALLSMPMFNVANKVENNTRSMQGLTVE